MESAHQQRTVAQPFSSTHSPRLFPNSASTQRPLRPFTLLAPSLEGSLEGSVILCPKSTKTAALTTFRINTCKGNNILDSVRRSCHTSECEERHEETQNPSASGPVLR